MAPRRKKDEQGRGSAASENAIGSGNRASIRKDVGLRSSGERRVAPIATAITSANKPGETRRSHGRSGSNGSEAVKNSGTKNKRQAQEQQKQQQAVQQQQQRIHEQCFGDGSLLSVEGDKDVIRNDRSSVEKSNSRSYNDTTAVSTAITVARVSTSSTLSTRTKLNPKVDTNKVIVDSKNSEVGSDLDSGETDEEHEKQQQQSDQTSKSKHSARSYSRSRSASTSTSTSSLSNCSVSPSPSPSPSSPAVDTANSTFSPTLAQAEIKCIAGSNSNDDGSVREIVRIDSGSDTENLNGITVNNSDSFDEEDANEANNETGEEEEEEDLTDLDNLDDDDNTDSIILRMLPVNSITSRVVSSSSCSLSSSSVISTSNSNTHGIAKHTASIHIHGNNSFVNATSQKTIISPTNATSKSEISSINLVSTVLDSFSDGIFNGSNITGKNSSKRPGITINGYHRGIFQSQDEEDEEDDEDNTNLDEDENNGTGDDSNAEEIDDSNDENGDNKIIEADEDSVTGKIARASGISFEYQLFTNNQKTQINISENNHLQQQQEHQQPQDNHYQSISKNNLKLHSNSKKDNEVIMLHNEQDVSDSSLDLLDPSRVPETNKDSSEDAASVMGDDFYPTGANKDMDEQGIFLINADVE
ncbi:hypothetical protein HK100_010210 [Physocladia obscura]|uniref:Uncharacterized protein n=1 Tax=Physocladia obscura TaxID=109957 RepID=A0AAD5T2J7_9FUNG|nr:hypothetical protein HK100_010210 [Physocladia obscura]